MRYLLCFVSTLGLAAAPLRAANDALDGTGVSRSVQRTQPADTAHTTTPRFGERLRNFFLPHHPSSTTNAPAPMTKGTPTAPIIQQAGNRQIAPVARMTPELSSQDLEKVGHEQDYSWITGKLFHTPAGWVIRYGGPYEVDTYSGIVTLAPTPELANFHEGDLVCVHGEVVNGAHGAGSSALYKIKDINRIEPLASNN